MECYHCRHAHPDFASLISMDHYRLDVGRIWSRQLGPETRPSNSAYDFDPDAGYPGSMFWYLWPNTTFNILPGSNELAVFRIRPIDHEWSSPVAAPDFRGRRPRGESRLRVVGQAAEAGECRPSPVLQPTASDALRTSVTSM